MFGAGRCSMLRDTPSQQVACHKMRSQVAPGTTPLLTPRVPPPNMYMHAPLHPATPHRCRVQRAESVAWLSLEEQLLEGLRQDPHVRWLLGRLLPMVRAGTMAPRSAADIALAYFYQHCG